MRTIKRDGGQIKRPAAGQLGCCCVVGCVDSSTNLLVLFSGLIACACADFTSPFAHYTVGDLSGVIGPYTAVWTGSSWDAPAIATVTVTFYDPNTGDGCTDVLSSSSHDIDLSVSCTSGVYLVSLTLNPLDVFFPELFSGSGPISTAIDNTYTDCSGGGSAHSGTATIST